MLKGNNCFDFRLSESVRIFPSFERGVILLDRTLHPLDVFTNKDRILQDRISAIIKEVPESPFVLEYIIAIAKKLSLSNNVYTQNCIQKLL